MSATPLLARLLRRPGGRRGLALLVVLAVLALAGPPLARDPLAQGDLVSGALRPPGGGHLLGTDHVSRDVLARTLHGLRRSLGIGLGATGLAAGLGLGIGLVAGIGGAAGRVLLRAGDALLAIPRLFLLLVVLAGAGTLSAPGLALAIGLTAWPSASRLAAAEARRLWPQDWMLAARALGASPARLVLVHLLPHAAAPVLVAAALHVADAVVLEAGLSFLGLGIAPPAPTLGGMLLEARPTLAVAPWPALAPGVALVLVVLALGALADALRAALDPQAAA
ncbi:MAG: ABC transporter permease [Gemmatimonadales bacterium]|nr:ABC transporter permease [Gemmatimonadales bacterium]